MKALSFGRQLILTSVLLALAGALPAQAARLSRAAGYRTAVFQTATTTKIAVGANYAASLANLSVGDVVSVAYDQENGALVAHHISDGVPAKPRITTLHAHAVHHHATVSPLAHVRGVVQSVNPQAGTLTLEYRVR